MPHYQCISLAGSATSVLPTAKPFSTKGLPVMGSVVLFGTRSLLPSSYTSAIPYPCSPLIEPLSPTHDTYPDARLAQHPCSEWFHASNWDHTPSAPRWPAWDVLLHLWSNSDLTVVFPQAVLRPPCGRPLVLYVYSAGGRLSKDVLDEINHHPANVIILDSTCQRMLLAVLLDRRRLRTIHYGGSGKYTRRHACAEPLPSRRGAPHYTER